MADPRYPVLEIYDPPPPYPYLDGQQPVVHSSAATAPPYEAASTGNDDGPLAKKDVATSNQIHVSVSSVQVPVATSMSKINSFLEVTVASNKIVRSKNCCKLMNIRA